MKHQDIFTHGGMRYGVTSWLPPEPDRASARPLVLVHGFAQSSSTWEGIASALDAPIHAFELLGHGASDRPQSAGAYALEAQARALLAFCAALPTPPVLVGYSMGGRVALAAAAFAVACAPERLASNVPFRALVLESAGLGPETSGAREELAARNAAWAQRVREEGVAAFMDFWEALPLFASQRDLPPVERAQLRREREANDASALAFSFEQAGAHAMPAREESLAALRALVAMGVPVLYLAGELDRKYCEVARALAAEPSLATCTVPGAGHSIHAEKPKEYARLLKCFAREGA